MRAKLEHQYGADALSEALEVSESGFAAHRGKPNGQRWKEDAELRVLIAQSFAESRNSYGSPRVRLDLRELGKRCGKNRIARLMGRAACTPGRSAVSGLAPLTAAIVNKIAEKLAGKGVGAGSGQLWQSDITSIETQEFSRLGCEQLPGVHNCAGSLAMTWEGLDIRQGLVLISRKRRNK